MPAMEPAGAVARSPASAPAHGRQQIAPIAQAVNGHLEGGSRRSTGFCATTPPA